jgi:hypothetical protein
MSTIFRKTAKGVTEIETRAHRLMPRLRSVLILVDGKRNDDELRRMLPQQCDEVLQALLHDGFIESVAGARPTPAAAPPAAAPARPAPAPASTMPMDLDLAVTVPPSTRPASGREISIWRRDAVRALTEQVGPIGEALAVRIERARTAAELLPLLQTAQQVIGNVRGKAAATAFRSQFIDE